MRILIGCEESGVLRRAFRKLGHHAWSNDLLPARDGSTYHIQGCVKQAIRDGDWDMIILHPDCTKRAVSGNRWYGKGTSGHNERLEQVAWTVDLWKLAKENAKYVALENPVSVIFTELKMLGAYVQYIQPWMFGHGETKATGFALHNLPDLMPTDIVDGREQRIWKMPPGENRKRDRSETFAGVADAIAEQWGVVDKCCMGDDCLCTIKAAMLRNKGE